MFVRREPFAYTWQRVCRVFIGLCRVQQAHGKPPVSRSVVNVQPL